ncbi:MAG: hypothetical protein U9R16_01905 [Campylobacterota bacterium]|nr:hypothetical protein [Campylobacterota bacterium]
MKKTNNITFNQIESVENLSQVLKETFDVDLDISGGWGYDNKGAVVVNHLDIPIDQFLHMFATIRANIEMNLMQDEDNRYGGINISFLEGEQFEIDNKIYDHITFEISAINEKKYAKYIQEYKDNYGKNKDFDMSDHFKRRKEDTITMQSDFWFYGLEKYYHDSKSENTTN